MNTEQAEQQPTDPHSNGRARIDSREFARRAKAAIAQLPSTLAQLPSTLDKEIQQSPHAVLGIAFGVGAAAGVFLSSRILRTVLASAVSYAAIELGRSYLRDVLGASWGEADWIRAAIDERPRER
ncbi:MAG: hypothetical protein ABSF69_21870 [Polyangiaceae bacterium]|jgi:hypothetical protein